MPWFRKASPLSVVLVLVILGLRFDAVQVVLGNDATSTTYSIAPGLDLYVCALFMYVMHAST